MIVRPARSSDAQHVARIYVQTWQQTYRGLLPDNYLAAMSVPRVKQTYLRRLDSGNGIWCVVEIDARQVVGFVSGGPSRNPDGIYDGEIYELYLLEAYRGLGLGKLLVQALAAEFKRGGIYSMMVWVLPEIPIAAFMKSSMVCSCAPEPSPLPVSISKPWPMAGSAPNSFFSRSDPVW